MKKVMKPDTNHQTKIRINPKYFQKFVHLVQKKKNLTGNKLLGTKKTIPQIFAFTSWSMISQMWQFLKIKSLIFTLLQAKSNKLKNLSGESLMKQFLSLRLI